MTEQALHRRARVLRGLWPNLVGDSGYTPAEVLIRCDRYKWEDDYPEPMTGAEADQVIHHMEGLDEAVKLPALTDAQCDRLARQLYLSYWREP